jgi:1-acyl-sn-glycerol-3-phosphate acyltransferase
MIRARRNPFLNKLIYILLIKSALRNSFFRVNLRQAAPSPTPNSPPLLLFCNHSAWWDGHMTMALNEERWRRAGHAMVEHKQLVRYPFFRAVGAFSIDRQNARSAIETLNYCVELMTSVPNVLVLIAPQGEILANDVRPLSFFNGVGRIVKEVAEKAGACAAYPMALRYEFIGEQKPEAFISIGAPLLWHAGDAATAKEITAHMQSALTHALDCLREDVTAYRLNSFEVLLDGGWSINRWWDALLGRQQINEVGRERH